MKQINSQLEQVRQFMAGVGQDVATETRFNPECVSLRLRLHAEEYEELVNAMGAGDLVEIADALADLMYVLLGTAVSMGIPLDEVFEEVQRSNMTKLLDGLKDEGGKVIKGPSYRPPNIEAVLAKHAVCGLCNGARIVYLYMCSSWHRNYFANTGVSMSELKACSTCSQPIRRLISETPCPECRHRIFGSPVSSSI